MIEYTEYNKKWYRVKKQILSQSLCIFALFFLGVNYLIYAFFQLNLNRNILRIVAGSCLILSILLAKRVSVKEMVLIPVAVYMLVINGTLSANIAYIILSSLAIPYSADRVWKKLNTLQILFGLIVAFSLLTGLVDYRVSTWGGRSRNALGFANVNATAVFFFSLILIWLLQLAEIEKKHLAISLIVSLIIYRVTDSRTAFLCLIMFAVSYLVINRWSTRKVAIAFDLVIILVFLSPLLVQALSKHTQLDLLFSFRLSSYASFMEGNSLRTFLFGGCKLEGVDSFYLCLLYNGGLFFYIFTMIMTVLSVHKYIIECHSGYASFIVSVSLFGLMESGVIRCELLCMVMYWYLILRIIKTEECEKIHES